MANLASEPNRDSVCLYFTEAPDCSWFITSVFWGAQDAMSARADIERSYRQVAKQLDEYGLTIVQERIFGHLHHCETVLKIRSRILAEPLLPSYLEGKPVNGGWLAGIHIRAVPKQIATPILWEGQLAGKSWQCGDEHFFLLSARRGHGDTPGLETTGLLTTAGDILQMLQLEPDSIVRTWFYNDRLLEWYDEFNAARTPMYQKWGISPLRSDLPLKLPASTAIQAKNRLGATVTADILAARRSQCTVEQMTNPGQQDAFQYGSAFSRGAVLRLEKGTVVELSGTASIDETGATIHTSNAAAQINCTLEKISMLLSPVGIGLQHLCAGVAFLKRATDAPLLEQAFQSRGLNIHELPLLQVEADVCRDDLLFEMDGEFRLQ